MIDLNVISSIASLGESVLERFYPDETKRAEEARKLKEVIQTGDIEKLSLHVSMMLRQADINLADAQSGNWFQAGWRPAIGWVGALSLAMMYIPKAIMLTVLWSWQNIEIVSAAQGVSKVVLLPFPDLGASEIIGLLGSMLGIAAMRSYEKTKGIDTKKK